MPAYSFQERFVPMVLDGSKPHTVRSRRKNPAKVGDTLYLYYGMRTKWCKKLRQEKCTDTHSLSISKLHGIVFYSRILTIDELEVAKKKPLHKSLPVDFKFTEKNTDMFAWQDGFRPEGTTKTNHKGAYELMIRFWTMTHELPWAGDIIYWEPKTLTK